MSIVNLGDISILSPKQKSAVVALLKSLERLERTESDHDRNELLKIVMEQGVAVYQLEKKLHRQLDSFDAELRERYPLPTPLPDDLSKIATLVPETDDELWIQNLHRAEVLADVLRKRDAVLAEVLDAAKQPFIEELA